MGQCTYPLYIGETGSCTDTTTATYNVQCTVEGTAITMVFDVTGVTNTEIGQWTCNTAIGVPPEAGIIITKLGNGCHDSKGVFYRFRSPANTSSTY